MDVLSIMGWGLMSPRGIIIVGNREKQGLDS